MDKPSDNTRGSDAVRRATLGDIALECGVSVGTASAVLSGKTKERRISDDLAARIRQVAAEMDYAPNLLVRSIQRGRTHMLSFFNGFRSRERRDAYMDALTTAIERACGEHGYDVAIYCDFRRSVGETYRYLNGGRSDGLIFFSPQINDPLLPYLRKSRLPVVLLGSVDEAGVLSSVREAGEAGMRQVAEHLLRQGHRRIAAFTSPPRVNPDAARRTACLRTLLMEHGVMLPDHWIIEFDFEQTFITREVLENLLQAPEPPTALFCWTDHLGYQVLELCEEMGVSVPDQLSVIGYDGLRWPARTLHTLASVKVDLDAMGETTVDLLDKLIDRSEEAPVQRVLPVAFDAGSTLAPPSILNSQARRAERR